MQYLVTGHGFIPFITKYFEIENHWSNVRDMVVYDLVNLVYTQDGKTWKIIEIDHL